METKIITKSITKKKINISKNEKSLLLLLSLVVIFWVFYKFIFTPQNEKIIQLESKIIGYEDRLITINEILAKDKLITDEWSNLIRDIKDLETKYFSTINQPQILNMLNEIVDSAQIYVPSIYFDEPGYETLNNIDTKYLEISIPFEGSYDDLGTFFSQLSTTPKKFSATQLSLTKKEVDFLSGQIGLRAYSYEGIMENKDRPIYTTEVQKVLKENPFQPFEGYSEQVDSELIDGSFDDLSNDEGDDSGHSDESAKRTVLEDLEDDNVYFMSSSINVTGKVTKFNDPKYDKYSLRTEYFISTSNVEERAYVTLDDKDLIIKYPPSSIGFWAKSYGYSPITIGLRFQDQEGKKIDLVLSEGVNWIGWDYIEAQPPQDVNLYPLKLDRIYLQLGANKDDYGVILFDRIEAFYPLVGEEKQDKGYTFYLVQHGDTLKSISEKFYGVSSKYNAIMKLNGLNNDNDLESGKILVIHK